MDNNVQQRIKDLEQLVLNSPDDNVRRVVQEQLDRLKERQKINVDKDFSGVITAINSLIEKVYNSSTAMSSQQIDQAIADRLKKLKINQENLSKELKELIGQTKTTVIQINEIKVSSSKGTKGRRLEDVLMSDAEAQNNVYIFGEAGTGKAMPLSSRVLAEDGWKTFADVKVGDKVWGEDGKLYEIDGVYDRGVKSVYGITMNDGGYAESCDEHLWKIYTRSDRSHKNNGRILPLSEFKDKIKTINGDANAFIDVSKAVNFSKKEHVIDPYLLGVILGDGSVTVGTPSITNPSQELFDSLVLPEGVELTERTYSERCLSYGITRKDNSSQNELTLELKRLGIFGNKSLTKFIPNEYLIDSLENRVSLLQGLNDTDGCPDGTHFEYSTSSEELANNYAELVRSVGGTAKIKSRIPYFTYNGIKKEGNLSFRVYCVFPDDIEPFKLASKKERFTKRTKYFPKRFIDQIVYKGEEEVRCISVTNPTHLYITDDYIVTHNTFVAGIIADKLNYKLITLNCNQFTSPLDIVGGQTIEGYKEGRLTQAWGNLDLGLNALGESYEGALLLLDELPKIDPNTAGILNDGLAKIKDGVKEITDSKGNKVQVPPSIMNGNGELIEKKKIFIIATGNSLLNEANKDYEANFKQDLSLQDRFAGSCYKITYNYKFEYEKIMTNVSTKTLPNVIFDLTFAFNFLSQLRMKIVELELTGVAFVSTRLMIVTRDTFVAYIVNRELAPNNIPEPKRISEVVKSFMSLFKKDQRENLEDKLKDQFKEFYNECAVKEALPLDQLNSSTKEQRDLAQTIIETAEANYAKDNAIPL
jgi:hypothetical protein